MAGKYAPLEKYLRDLPVTQKEETLTLAEIREILEGELPPSAHTDRAWWGNQKPGMQVEMIPWMDAGWLVEHVDFHENRVRFVRQ